MWHANVLYALCDAMCRTHVIDVHVMLYVLHPVLRMIWFQIFLSAFRFIALATMMITSLVSISSHPNPLLAIDTQHAHAPYISDISAATWSGLSTVIPVAIYGQIFHHSVPGLARVSGSRHDMSCEMYAPCRFMSRRMLISMSSF